MYSNLAGVIIVTIIKKHPKDKWDNTMVNVQGGRLTIPQNVSSPLCGEWMEYLNDVTKIEASEQQQKKLLERIKKNPEKFKSSEFYRLLHEDRKLKRK